MVNPKTLNAVMIGVRDFDVSIAWYKEHFGFQRLYGTPSGVVIGVDGIELILAQVKNLDDARIAKPEEDVCLRSFGFEVTKEDLAMAETEFENVEWFDHPRYKSGVIKDPDGHKIELYLNKRA